MGKAFLPPGFRFHPTDTELVMYYLKRKVTGKKLHFEAIAEVNIYQFSPWDLPDMSCLKSKDREWFFFCPREKKYASGVRVKRATENGYWKTTGKGRPVSHNGQIVGMVKTLVFHLGHSPNGRRTDWVIHEYRIVDKAIASADHLETYTLCKVFEKSGMGPKNGAQYGAPFNEAEWFDDEDEPVKIQSPALETQLPQCQGVPSLSAGQLSTDVPVIENDHEIEHMLSHFTDDPIFSLDAASKQGAHVEAVKSHPSSDGFDLYDGLDDLDIHPRLNEDHLYLSGMHHENNELNPLFLDEMGYIELDDLMGPLTSSAEELLFGCYGANRFQQLNHQGTGLNQYPLSSAPLPPFPTGTMGTAGNPELPQTTMPSTSGCYELLPASNAATACGSEQLPPPQQ